MVTITKELIENIDELKIHVDGVEKSYTTSSTDDSWTIIFTYQHSTHEVVVSLTPPSKPFIETPLGIATISGVIISIIALGFIMLRRRVFVTN